MESEFWIVVNAMKRMKHGEVKMDKVKLEEGLLWI